MEPHFFCQKIGFIYLDQLITNELQIQIPIVGMYILHRYSYHILDRVFPKIFGFL